MRPNVIQSTAHTAVELTRERGRGTPEALLLAWVAWEGLKVRLLVVGFAKMGWLVQDVYEALESERVGELQVYRRLFKYVYGTFPDNTRVVGTPWRGIEEARVLRHRYVHGMGTASPERLLTATNRIAEAVLDCTWLECLTVKVGGQRVRIGHPYARLPSRKRSHRPKSELRAIVADAKRR